jgi:hypothetical protein
MTDIQGVFYTIFLSLHNLARWLVIVFAVLAVVRGFSGWLRQKAWTVSDNRAGLLYTSLLDLQLLIGLILYFFLSPTTRIALQNFGGAMRDTALRYFAVEHFATMLLALIVAHAGRALSKKAQSDAARHRQAAIWYTISFLLVLVSIPWPFLSVGRPLLRFFGLF